MEGRDSIPKEIEYYLSDKEGHSLLIKGEPGSGKSTFAVQAMEGLYGAYRTEYISIRTSEESLYRQFPWLQDEMRKKEILEDARNLLDNFYSEELIEAVSLEEVQQSQIFLARQFLNSIYELEEERKGVEKEALEKLEGKVERGEIIADEDELNDKLKNEFVLEIGKTLPELERAYDLVKRYSPKKCLVIIDSIEALSEHYGIPEERLIDTLQQDLCEKSGTDLLIISEERGKTKMDFIVDGIVELSRDTFKGRKIRKLDIVKLKGSSVSNTSAKKLYTLEDGRFRVIESELRLPEELGIEPRLTEQEGFISTGFEDIDEKLGGLKAPGFNLLKVEGHVPSIALKTLMEGIVVNSCLLDRGTIVLPPFGTSAATFRHMISRSLPEDKMDNLLVLQHGEIEAEKNSKEIDGNELARELKREILEYELSGSKKPFTVLLSFDTLQSLYGEDIASSLGEVIADWKEDGHSMVGIAPKTLSFLDKIEMGTDRVYGLDMVEDTVCIYSEKPRTEVYGLSFEDREVKLKSDLVPFR